MAARKPMQVEALSEHYGEHFFAAVNGESPLACVLIVATYLENAVMTLLNNYFIECETATKIFGTSRPLGSFSACIDLAYCIGFYDVEMYKNLDIIRSIRNDFAHGKEQLTFETPLIAEQVKSLTLPKISATKVNIEGWTGEPHLIDLLQANQTTPQVRFVFITNAMFNFLWFKARSVERQRVQMVWNKRTPPTSAQSDSSPSSNVASTAGVSDSTSATTEE